MSTFREYLDERGLTQAEASRQLGISAPLVHRAYHQNEASRSTIARIRDWSGGAVTFDDFHPPKQRQGAA